MNFNDRATARTCVPASRRRCGRPAPLPTAPASSGYSGFGVGRENFTRPNGSFRFRGLLHAARRSIACGGVRDRDGSYHQGTVWPWLAGAFVEAWVRVRGGTPEAKAVARERFLMPLLRHRDEAGVGHVSEIADAEAPHTPRGCPFQAWSVGEVLRVERLLGGS